MGAHQAAGSSLSVIDRSIIQFCLYKYDDLPPTHGFYQSPALENIDISFSASRILSSIPKETIWNFSATDHSISFSHFILITSFKTRRP